MKRIFLLIGLWVTFFNFSFVISSIANNNGIKEMETRSPIDTILFQNLGKEYANLILETDTIEARIVEWGGDSLPHRILHPWMKGYVLYTLCQPTMYKSNRKVYSGFTADAYLRLHSGNEEMIIELDYNIFKWRFLDEKEEEVCRYDMFAQDFLPMLYILFPESQLLKIKYKKYIEKYEK